MGIWVVWCYFVSLNRQKHPETTKMLDLTGEYDISVDTKGRILLPTALRKQFLEGTGDRFVLNRGFDNCLNVFPMETWAIEKAKINELDPYDEDARKFKRLFLNGATIVEVDSADRLLIPKQLQEHANIKKDAKIVLSGDRMELWDESTYYAFINDNIADFSNLAKKTMSKKGQQTQP